MAWRNRIVGVENVEPEQLLAHPENWRRHPPAQRDALRGSLNELGWIATVIVNKRTGYVIDGHARIEEAISKHEKTVPVLYLDLTQEEERIALASYDPIGEMASRDQEALDSLLTDLHVEDAGLQKLLDSLAIPIAGKEPKAPPESPTDEVTCPECGATFPIGVRVKPRPGSPKGDEMAGGN